MPEAVERSGRSTRADRGVPVRIELEHQLGEPWVERLVDDGLVEGLQLTAETEPGGLVQGRQGYLIGTAMPFVLKIAGHEPHVADERLPAMGAAVPNHSLSRPRLPLADPFGAGTR